MKDGAQLAGDRSGTPALGDVLDFLRVIWAVDHALQRSSKRLEMATGVTIPQHLVIRIVKRFPGIPAGHLAALLHVHPGTLSGILKRLERQGLLRRRPDPRDGRRSLVGLTEKGRLFDSQTESVVEETIQRVLERTPSGDLQTVRGVLEAIATSLSAPRGPSLVSDG